VQAKDRRNYLFYTCSIIVPEMHQKAAATPKVLIVLFLVCAVVCAQGASFASGHSHRHSSQHCCSLCHAGPLPLIQPAAASVVAPVLSMAWLEWSSGLDAPRLVLLAAGYSRAPPA
jgi:hypothetical protein